MSTMQNICRIFEVFFWNIYRNFQIFASKCGEISLTQFPIFLLNTQILSNLGLHYIFLFSAKKTFQSMHFFQQLFDLAPLVYGLISQSLKIKLRSQALDSSAYLLVFSLSPKYLFRQLGFKNLGGSLRERSKGRPLETRAKSSS